MRETGTLLKRNKNTPHNEISSVEMIIFKLIFIYLSTLNARPIKNPSRQPIKNSIGATSSYRISNCYKEKSHRKNEHVAVYSGSESYCGAERCNERRMA